MSAAQKPEPGTAVATTTEKPGRALAPEHQRIVDENRARNALVQQIRGTIWGKEVSDIMARAVAQYCRENQLDAVRHVEVLGGRIYLTAEFYDERGAELLRAGVIVPAEPDYINADARLDELAKMGDSWACAEEIRRKRERIRWGVPEDAKAAVVQRFIIAESGKAVVGVNWCGQKSGKRDPVGDAEPSKTAQTRARRRAWKQIADVIPGYAAMVRPIEERARALPVAVVDAPDSKRLPQPVITNLGYEQDAPRVVDGTGRPEIRESFVTSSPAESQGNVGEVEDILAEDRELAEQEDLALDTPPRGRRDALREG
jgi:hypothetical protein